MRCRCCTRTWHTRHNRWHGRLPHGAQRSATLSRYRTGSDGNITDWWSAQIAYAYLDAKYEKTDDQWAAGRSVAYMPKHNLSIWNKFRIYQDPDYGRVHFGIGLKTWSKAHGTWRNPAVTDSNPYGRNTDWNPGYALVDMGIFWENQLRNGKKLK